MLPGNPALAQHGINFAFVMGIFDGYVEICLCSQSKLVVKCPKEMVCVIDHEQVPRELQKYMPDNKMTNNELRERLDRIETKLVSVLSILGMVQTAH